MGNRMDMLKKITKSKASRDIDVELFKKYIPTFYPQIYSFYSLLDSCKVLYKNLCFEEPIVIDDSITIRFSLSKRDYDILREKIKSVEGEIKYLRNHKFKISLDGNHELAILNVINA